MQEDGDWRLRDQENYLKGVTLVHRKYRQYESAPNWDHDHCEFCWVKFMVEDHPDVLHEGWTTEDNHRWICNNCFDDFKEMFEFEIGSLAEDDSAI